MENLFKDSENIQNMAILPNVSFLTTLRQAGYNNYTAIAEFVDNSLDNDVDSKNVWVKINPSFKNILVIDDGNGMDFEALNEALKLGSQTGKDPTIDLGNYGTGAKSAALSIGKKLTIKTKKVDGDFLIAVFDYDEMINSNIWYAPIGIGSDEEYEYFKSSTHCEHGTIIEITNLDRISNSNLKVFKDTLTKKFSLFYKYIIEEKNINIFLNEEKIKPFDPMWRKESWSKPLSEFNETFEYNNKIYKFNAYYLENQSPKFSAEIERNQAKAGLYIYRNYRLVGEGLGLGVIEKYGDGYLNGYRVELFVDGNDDSLFGSTFLKMVAEKDKNDINQGFKDKLKETLNKYTNAARSIGKIRENNSHDNDPAIDEIFKKSFEEINKSKLINVKGRNNKIDKGTPDIQHPGRNKFSKRHRDFVEWQLVDLGEAGAYCKFGRNGGKHVIFWNISHVFWKDFLCKYAKFGNGEVVNIVNIFAVAQAIAQEDKLNYSENPEFAALIDEYHLQISEVLRKLMNKFI